MVYISQWHHRQLYTTDDYHRYTLMEKHRHSKERRRHEDMKFTINSLEKLKLFLLRNELIRNGATSATDHNTEAKQVTNDVINPTRIYSKTNYASCLNTLTFQSDKGSHSINSTFINSEIPTQQKHCWYNNTTKSLNETSDFAITRKPRPPNRIMRL